MDEVYQELPGSALRLRSEYREIRPRRLLCCCQNLTGVATDGRVRRLAAMGRGFSDARVPWSVQNILVLGLCRDGLGLRWALASRRGPEGRGERHSSRRASRQVWRQPGHLLQGAQQVWRGLGVGREAAPGARSRERQTETDVGGPRVRERGRLRRGACRNAYGDRSWRRPC
jgi:hypothetical protein